MHYFKLWLPMIKYKNDFEVDGTWEYIAEKNIRLAYDKSKPSINTKLALDCTKAKDLFGWQPKVSLKKGIQKTIDWYKSNKLIN